MFSLGANCRPSVFFFAILIISFISISTQGLLRPQSDSASEWQGELMNGTKACLLVLGLSFTLGCGSESMPKGAANPPSNPSNPSTPSTPGPSIVSISPTEASAGSPEITLTITGLNFDHEFKHTSIAFWTTDPKNLHDHGTMLQTTLVDGGQLTAVIPGALLQTPTSVQIVVLTGDSMGMSDGFFGYPESNSVVFSVTP
jgi:IPT/TIG domain